jgi:UDP-N-acetylmuramoyl-L-alanine---L-glutamate ligase
MGNTITKSLKGKRILILGFGKEGISTYNYLRKQIPEEMVAIADQDEGLLKKINVKISEKTEFNFGKNYLERLNDFDVIIKSPGISTGLLRDKTGQDKITSQTELFLKSYASQTIGITGTKGKSTTSSLIAHILSSHLNHTMLVGNIGKPPFDFIDEMRDETIIVFELSSHQLENIRVSPFIAVILNIYQEHLDHYDSFRKYQLAKFNITKFQKKQDWFILNEDDAIIANMFKSLKINRRILSYSKKALRNEGCHLNQHSNVVCSFENKTNEFNFAARSSLPGDHNLMNIMAVVCVAKIMKVPDKKIIDSVMNFKGLRHRMEYLGVFRNIHFYNDSISTIPQSTIHAVKSLANVDTLILGGKDRGIDYLPLIEFLPGSGVSNIIFMGEAGRRIFDGVKSITPKSQSLFVINNFSELKTIIREHTRPGMVCLLSPAASSYDMFRNFEERGDAFEKIAENL